MRLCKKCLQSEKIIKNRTLRDTNVKEQTGEEDPGKENSQRQEEERELIISLYFILFLILIS